jgi:hypothetical protein
MTLGYRSVAVRLLHSIPQLLPLLPVATTLIERFASIELFRFADENGVDLVLLRHCRYLIMKVTLESLVNAAMQVYDSLSSSQDQNIFKCYCPAGRSNFIRLP